MSIESLKTKIEKQLEKTRASGKAEDQTKLNELRAELGATLAEGAKVCPNCGNAPFGIEQPAGVSGMVITLYEIGCLTDRDHRARGQTREQAVERWNKGEYLAK